MSPDEYRATFKDPMFRPKRNKYNAKPCEVDGIKFASKREAAVYQELKIRQKAGEIYGLAPHPTWRLVVNDHDIGRYTADFSYLDKLMNLHVIDVKAKKAPAGNTAFQLRRKLMLACHGITVEVVY